MNFQEINGNRSDFLFLAGLVLIVGLIATGSASAQLAAQDREILEQLYQSTNGPEWRRNDGWLVPGVEPCDWYGVDCRFNNRTGHDQIRALALPDNNLDGPLPEAVIQAVTWQIDLSGNRLTGTLSVLPRSPAEVDLSDNRLGGPLPERRVEPGQREGFFPSDMWRLDLSGNRFEGEVPETWAEFGGFNWLDLSDNRLEGMPTPLFERLTGLRGPFGQRLAYLNLAGNRFSGELPDVLLETSIIPHNSVARQGGGINLCWNDFTVDDPALDEWLGQHHIGGENHADCLGRQRVELESAVSGSWFDPGRSGEGLVVHLLDRGEPLLYWFTFDDAGGQRWLINTGSAAESHMRWRELVQTRGRFGQGFMNEDSSAREVRGSMRFDLIGEGTAQAEQVFITERHNICLAVFPPMMVCFGNSVSDRLEHVQLSRLAGTRCDNRHELQWVSGSWFDPERAGEGFVVEVLEDGRAIVYWFTHEPDDSGDQAWMIGVGGFDGQTLVINELFRPMGARFGNEFNPADVEMVPWGSLKLEFFNGDEGFAVFESLFEEFGAGQFPLVRLARPKLAECEFVE